MGSALGAAGLPTQALPETIYTTLVEGAATGTWPDGSTPGTVDLDAFFRKNGPAWHVAQRPQAEHPGALRPGRDRQPLPAAAGAEELRATR